MPIGTVVMLKDSESRVMIGGYASVTESDPGRIWDYSGFVFPIGYTDNDKIYSFDSDQIEYIVQYGFCDYEWEEFIEHLSEGLKQLSHRQNNSEEE